MAEPLGVQVMTTKQEQHLLSDHVDMRLVGVESDEGTIDRNAIVQLNPDHPGFRDQEYRARRNQIAQLATNYRPGDPIPDAPYTPDEHRVWQTIWKALGPAHQKHACAEYLSALDRLSFAPERIPQLREGNEKVQAISGFRLEPVAGLMHEAELRPFDLDAASSQAYDPTHFQPVLFCGDSFEKMYQMLRNYLVSW